MDWFERLTGFREAGYKETQARLRVVDDRLMHEATGETFAFGTLTLPSVAEMRAAASRFKRPGRLRLSIVEGDVRALHRAPQNHGALFRVASQFNMLEMIGPDVTPEDGVASYMHDRTQGPACAMAGRAATIYRNYLVPVGAETGQTRRRSVSLTALPTSATRSPGALEPTGRRYGGCATATPCRRERDSQPSRNI